MGGQPRPQQGSPGKGMLPGGAGGRKTARRRGSQPGAGVYQGGWERSWPDLEGSSVGWEKGRETGAIQPCSKKSGERKEKQAQTHTGWLPAGQGSWYNKPGARL